jgi:putative ABC transport system ATP-binding protein
MAAAAQNLFQVRRLTKTYRTGAGEVRALRGVDLDIRAGETLVLLGPSGSGKSTLLNILGGLDRATSGQFHGTDLVEASDAELTVYRRRSVGFIFQFFNLSASLTAGENVELITEIADDPMSPEEALALVGLEDRIDHFPAELSGGQQQRVAVARAIAKRPEVLFCDRRLGALARVRLRARPRIHDARRRASRRVLGTPVPGGEGDGPGGRPQCGVPEAGGR